MGYCAYDTWGSGSHEVRRQNKVRTVPVIGTMRYDQTYDMCGLNIQNSYAQ